MSAFIDIKSFDTVHPDVILAELVKFGMKENIYHTGKKAKARYQHDTTHT